MEYPIKIDLQRPVTVDGNTTTQLVFDEPDLRTSIAVEEAPTRGAQTLELLAGMAGVSIEIIGRVKESDYTQIRRRVLDPYQAHIAASHDAELGNGELVE